MRLPIQPKTVKPKTNTIANMIQSRFTPASFVLRSRRRSRGAARRHPRPELGSGRGEAHTRESRCGRGGVDDFAVDFPGRIANVGRGEQLGQTPAGVPVAFLCRAEPRIERLGHGEPRAPSLKQSPMTIEQLDAGQTQRQPSRSLELLV